MPFNHMPRAYFFYLFSRIDLVAIFRFFVFSLQWLLLRRKRRMTVLFSHRFQHFHRLCTHRQHLILLLPVVSNHFDFYYDFIVWLECKWTAGIVVPCDCEYVCVCVSDQAEVLVLRSKRSNAALRPYDAYRNLWWNNFMMMIGSRVMCGVVDVVVAFV